MLGYETEVHGEKPIAMPLGPLQLTYGMTWGRTTFSSMTGQYIITRNMARLKVCSKIYRDAEKSLARPTSQCILFDGENISFDASLVIYINSTNIPPIMFINRIYETQNLLSL